MRYFFDKHKACQFFYTFLQKCGKNHKHRINTKFYKNVGACKIGAYKKVALYTPFFSPYVLQICCNYIFVLLQICSSAKYTTKKAVHLSTARQQSNLHKLHIGNVLR